MIELSQEAWAERLAEDDKSVILDVRTSAECAQGIIPNANCIDIRNNSAFMARVVELDKSKHYYVYCRSGARSAQACRILLHEGFTCYNLLGGILQWQGELIKTQD